MSFGAYDGFVSKFIEHWTRPSFWKFWEPSLLSHSTAVLTVDEKTIADLLARKDKEGRPILNPPRIDKAPPRVVLIESTILSDKKGVQVNWASERIADYPGRVYGFPLSAESQRKFDVTRFTEFMLSIIGRPYDKVLIAHLLFDKFNVVPSREDWDAMICSECVAAGYKVGGILPANLNSSEVTPQRLPEFRLWAADYFQLRGKPKDIKRYNTRTF